MANQARTYFAALPLRVILVEKVKSNRKGRTRHFPKGVKSKRSTNSSFVIFNLLCFGTSTMKFSALTALFAQSLLVAPSTPTFVQTMPTASVHSFLARYYAKDRTFSSYSGSQLVDVNGDGLPGQHPLTTNAYRRFVFLDINQIAVPPLPLRLGDKRHK